MAGWEDKEKALIELGRPYLFTKNQYEYCKGKNAPIAVIYYDTKTSAASQDLYAAVFKEKSAVNALYRKLSEDAQYMGGYCCLFVLDRRGKIENADPDREYFVNEVFKPKKNSKFPILFLSFGGKTAYWILGAQSGIEQFAQTLYQKGESGAGGVGKFSQWDGRETWLEHQVIPPDPEIKATGGVKNDIIAIDAPPFYQDPTTESMAYADYDPGENGEFAGIGNITSRPDVTYLLNLADISTPETTYCLVGAYDMNFSTQCPKTADTYVVPYIEKRCDNIVKLWNGDAKKNFAEMFKKGSEYRYFIFLEFSHGNYRSITIGITYQEIWNTIMSMAPTQRIWGFFDSCHSGSMIEYDGLNAEPNEQEDEEIVDDEEIDDGATPEGADDDDDILNFLANRMAERAGLISTANGGSVEAAAASVHPRMILWSCTGPHSYGWYFPTSSTVFMNGFNATMQDTFWSNGSATYTYNRARYGWADDNNRGSKYDKYTGEYVFRRLQFRAHRSGRDTLHTSIPRCRNYPSNDSFRNTIIFY